MVNLKLFDEQSYPFQLIFYVNGEEAGKLIENENGELSFKGNVDESAELLFEKIIKINSKFINNNINKKQKKVA